MDDLISRQAAIDELMAWEEDSFWDDECLKHRGEPYWVAPSDVIEHLPSAQQWIPCSERLPKESGDYLVTVERYSGEWWVEVDQFDNANGSWWRYMDEVIAWMPLPEPYKGETE